MYQKIESNCISKMSLFRSIVAMVFVKIKTYYQSNNLIRGKKNLLSIHSESIILRNIAVLKKNYKPQCNMLVSGFSFNLFPPIFKNLNHASPPSTNEYDLINKDFNLLNKGNSFCNKKCKLTRKKVI